jgi:pyruvate formate lyase activating enzyme
MQKYNEEESLTGIVFDIYRGTMHDGPGLRTTVFLKGCPLKCLWCHNPEGINRSPEIKWVKGKCIGCRNCVKACPNSARIALADRISVNEKLCNNCIKCVKACPSKALQMSGETWTVDALVKEVLKDRSFFESFGGGVTISGGEPTVQYEFVEAFLMECKRRNISTALDTCGMAHKRVYESLLKYTDYLLYDIKEIDSDRHKKFTGAYNEKILENLIFIRDYIIKHKTTKLWIRTPLIPGATATNENIKGIGGFISKELYDVVEKWELCAFNNLCKDKYNQLGLSWVYEQSSLMEKNFTDTLLETAQKSGVNPEIIVFSGITIKL